MPTAKKNRINFTLDESVYNDFELFVKVVEGKKISDVLKFLVADYLKNHETEVKILREAREKVQAGHVD